MSERPVDLPEFQRPPVTEVVLGVQFKTEVPLKAPHLGLFWQTIRNDFPGFREQPPLSSPVESLEPDAPPVASPRVIQIGTGAPPAPRCWFIDASGSRLIQLQTDWFLHNWRKVTGEEEYPRFEAIRDQFVERWHAFVAFLNDQELGEATVTQAEVTYVNHIPKGSCWTDVDNVPKVFSCLKDVDDTALFGPMETIEFTIRRRLPDNRGRLHVTAAPAFNTKDQSVLIRMVLTARGPVEDSSGEAILDWMAMARAAIVNGFTALTTPEAHNFWGRTK